MKYNIIHIFGAAGSGTTTIGREIARKYNYFHMDTDDYFWMPTDPKFTTRRKKEERLELMKKDIAEHEKVVISGSLVGWGDELIPFFELAIRTVIEPELRLKRIKDREMERFGSRIEEGGDMYEQHLEFMEWAAQYDTAGVNMRSKAKHDEWQKLLNCQVIAVDSGKTLEQIMLTLDVIINKDET